MTELVARQPKEGLFPLFINVDTGAWTSPHSYSTGALGDSFYEVLLKLWIFEGKSMDSDLLKAWNASWAGMKSQLLKKSRNGHTFLAEVEHGVIKYSHQHLSCHMSAVLLQAYEHLGDAEYLQVAKELCDTCWYLYRDSPTGFAPEIVLFQVDDGGGAAGEDRDYQIVDAKYILRPEFVESLYFLYMATGEEEYRNRAWAVFESLERYCKVPSGAFSGLKDVRLTSEWNDSQQSFFFAETLKYLYLTFDPEALPRSKSGWLFTTEAHPVEIKKVD